MKKGTTIYFDADIEEKLKLIPKSYKTRFVNQVMREYFEKNSKIELKIELNIGVGEAPKENDLLESKDIIPSKKEDMF